MNEFEKLIANLPRPTPSDELDARVADLFHRPEARRSSQTRGLLVLACTTACAAMAGFLVGRTSVTITDDDQRAARRPAVETRVSENIEGPEVVSVDPAESAALARFVMPGPQFPSLFGTLRLEVQDVSIPSE